MPSILVFSLAYHYYKSRIQAKESRTRTQNFFSFLFFFVLLLQAKDLTKAFWDYLHIIYLMYPYFQKPKAFLVWRRFSSLQQKDETILFHKHDIYLFQSFKIKKNLTFLLLLQNILLWKLKKFSLLKFRYFDGIIWGPGTQTCSVHATYKKGVTDI